MNSEVRKKLILVCIFLPFPLIFINSAHFFRQFLAGALVVFAVYGVEHKKIRLFVFLLAGFVHSSAMIFIIFMLVPIKVLKFKQMALLCLSIPLLLKALSVLPYLETGYPIIDVLYYRLVMQTGPPLEMSILAFIAAVVVLIISTWKSGFESPDDELKNQYVGLTALVVIIVYFSPAMIELSLRFAYYIWMFLPIFLATRINIRSYPIMMFISLGLSCFISVFYVMNNQWDYSCGLERLLTFEIGFSSCVY
jgi:hypothetical protein